MDFYGDMPLSDYTGKVEVTTSIFDDPNEIFEYSKEILTETGTEAPYYESGDPRHSYNLGGEDIERGSETTGHGGIDGSHDYHGTSYGDFRLNMQTVGTRYGIEPDNTEQFMGFTDADPKGVAVGSNMRECVREAYDRGRIYASNFKSDEDYSIPDRALGEREANENRQKSYNYALGKLYGPYNFTESYSSRATPGARSQNIFKGHQQDTILLDGVALDMNGDDVVAPRLDGTTWLSNNKPIGWQMTTDHRFKTSYINPTMTQFNSLDVAKIRDYVESQRPYTPQLNVVAGNRTLAKHDISNLVDAIRANRNVDVNGLKRGVVQRVSTYLVPPPERGVGGVNSSRFGREKFSWTRSGNSNAPAPGSGWQGIHSIRIGREMPANSVFKVAQYEPADMVSMVLKNVVRTGKNNFYQHNNTPKQGTTPQRPNADDTKHSAKFNRSCETYQSTRAKKYNTTGAGDNLRGVTNNPFGHSGVQSFSIGAPTNKTTGEDTTFDHDNNEFSEISTY